MRRQPVWKLRKKKLPAFRQAINVWAAEHAPRPGAPELKLDAVVQLSELTLPNVQELSRLAPFGRENPMPVLLVCDAMIDGIWPMGAEGRHTRCGCARATIPCLPRSSA